MGGCVMNAAQCMLMMLVNVNCVIKQISVHLV